MIMRHRILGGVSRCVWGGIVVSCDAKKKDSAHDAKLSLLLLLVRSSFWSRAHRPKERRENVSWSVNIIVMYSAH